MDVLARVWSPRHVRFDLGKASTAPIRVVSAIGQLYELSDSARAASRHVDFARRWHSCKSIVEPKMSLNLADLAQSLSDSDATTATPNPALNDIARSEENTSELQSLMRISYAVFCLNKKNNQNSYIRRNTYN